MANGLRELIAENRQSAMTAAALLIVVAVGSLAYHIFFASKSSPVGTGYFSIDQGVTWFRDSEDRITPFESESGPGLRVRLYRCKQHGDFAGYLERASEEGGRQARNAFQVAPEKANPDATRVEVASILGSAAEIKPLGPSNAWVRKESPEGDQLVLAVKCPKGPDDPVIPIDP